MIMYKKSIVFSLLFFSNLIMAEEWSAHIYPPNGNDRYIGRFETQEDCEAKAECYIKKANRGGLLGVLFANKIESGSYLCSISTSKETEAQAKEAKKWIGKFIFGLTDESCSL